MILSCSSNQSADYDNLGDEAPRLEFYHDKTSEQLKERYKYQELVDSLN